ncbi:MAG: hypothetical protein AAB585_01970 [Patescibacteria group bacterium]
MEKNTAAVVGFSAEIIYQISGKTETHLFGPFPGPESLNVAIAAHECSLEYLYRYNWREIERKLSSPSPVAV